MKLGRTTGSVVNLVKQILVEWNILVPGKAGFRSLVYLCIYKVEISVCLSDHNSGTPGPICLKFRFGSLALTRKVLSIWVV